MITGISSFFIVILFYQTVVAKKHRHIHIYTHTYKYTNIFVHTQIIIYTHTTVYMYVEAVELHDMADTLFH